MDGAIKLMSCVIDSAHHQFLSDFKMIFRRNILMSDEVVSKIYKRLILIFLYQF